MSIKKITSDVDDSQDFEKLKSFFKSASDLTLEEKDLSVRGWNWGKANFIGNALHFDVEGQVRSSNEHVAFFFVADTLLYKRLCLSVGPARVENAKKHAIMILLFLSCVSRLRSKFL